MRSDQTDLQIWFCFLDQMDRSIYETKFPTKVSFFFILFL